MHELPHTGLETILPSHHTLASKQLLHQPIPHPNQPTILSIPPISIMENRKMSLSTTDLLDSRIVEGLISVDMTSFNHTITTPCTLSYPNPDLSNLPEPTWFFVPRKHSTVDLASHHALCHYYQDAAGRPLTQPEANAITHRYTGLRSLSSRTSDICISTGLFFAFRGRKTLRFPFWQPRETGL